MTDSRIARPITYACRKNGSRSARDLIFVCGSQGLVVTLGDWRAEQNQSPCMEVGEEWPAVSSEMAYMNIPRCVLLCMWERWNSFTPLLAGETCMRSHIRWDREINPKILYLNIFKKSEIIWHHPCGVCLQLQKNQLKTRSTISDSKKTNSIMNSIYFGMNSIWYYSHLILSFLFL